ncbi:hypothetical protein GCM10007320_35160 [Pseudorhodoferax aquiterrae]|uniref:CzcE family metal-binding protein n=1 Tax=Pseudorhodoferax aquiterrae TaxID=747304 RepID=A0ABQ3G5R7_9BURK|nr:CzcE family metal-binding protein [Pseudorhodoferax aquiterrae]GHC88221.1 hypothetical protein GCM10007320_35160 [Pseudorhodoferax aquiterrae]
MTFKPLWAALAGVLVSTHVAGATFPTGESYFGSQVPAAKYYRVVDLASPKHINVTCGETVTFVKDGRQFTWNFNSIRHSRVAIDQFAPKGFDAAGKVVYIARGEHERGS